MSRLDDTAMTAIDCYRRRKIQIVKLLKHLKAHCKQGGTELGHLDRAVLITNACSTVKADNWWTQTSMEVGSALEVGIPRIHSRVQTVSDLLLLNGTDIQRRNAERLSCFHKTALSNSRTGEATGSHYFHFQTVLVLLQERERTASNGYHPSAAEDRSVRGRSEKSD